MAEIMVRYDDLRLYCEKRHCGSVPLEYIKQMPTIEAEPVRHGRWIYRSDDAASCYCSECNEEALTAPYERNCIESDFCPCCGAKMDGKDINVITKGGGADNSKEDLFRKILSEVDYYYSTRKQMCYPIGYPDMLIYAVHCAVNGNHEEAFGAIERARKARIGA